MSVDTKDVAKIAHLARIRVDQAKLEPMTAELNNILDWIGQLNEVDTDGVEPMTSAVQTELRWRDDKVDDGGKQGDVLANAPDARFGFYAVPKVIE